MVANNNVIHYCLVVVTQVVRFHCFQSNDNHQSNYKKNKKNKKTHHHPKSTNYEKKKKKSHQNTNSHCIKTHYYLPFLSFQLFAASHISSSMYQIPAKPEVLQKVGLRHEFMVLRSKNALRPDWNVPVVQRKQ